jgi:hypothetical protein
LHDFAPVTMEEFDFQADFPLHILKDDEVPMKSYKNPSAIH